MFATAKKENSRLKMLVWGATGTGKTVLSLHFPGVCLIDPEGRADQYADKFEFGLEKPKNLQDVLDCLDFLATGKHDFKTLVLDHAGWYWDQIQEKWSEILKAKKGIKSDEFFDFQFNDWKVIKRDQKLFINKLQVLDMNVIYTARETTEYADGQMAKKVGVRPDCEKNLPYEVDVCCRLTKKMLPGNREVFMCVPSVQSKDTNNVLPKGEFEFSAEMFTDLLGETMTRKATKTILPKSKAEEEAEKVEKAKLIGEIKEISSTWDQELWQEFRKKHIGDSKVLDLSDLRKLRKALVPEHDKPAEGDGVEPSADNVDRLQSEKNRVGWDTFNAVLSRVSNKSIDDLDEADMEKLLEQLSQEPDALGKNEAEVKA